MSTDYKRVRGQDVELVASTAANSTTKLSNWKGFSADVMIGEDEATACPSSFEQFSDGLRKATGSVSGFTGSSETMADLPQPGDILETLSMKTVTEGADLLPDLGDETKYGKIKVIKTHYSQDVKPSEWSFDWRSGGFENPEL